MKADEHQRGWTEKSPHHHQRSHARLRTVFALGFFIQTRQGEIRFQSLTDSKVSATSSGRSSTLLRAASGLAPSPRAW